MKVDQLERYPYNGTFELTARCNLKCKMCLIRIDNSRMLELGGRERTADEWIHMAKEIHEAGTLKLLLTGGEPMLRKDFVELYRAIASMGFVLTLYTNATLVTREIIEVLREYPPHEIGITIYGASPETYERVTGNANAYYQMLEGLSLLKQLPSLLSIRTTIIQENIEDLDKITDQVMELGREVSVDISRLVTKPVRGGIADVESCRLSPEENVEMMERRFSERLVIPFLHIQEKDPEVVSKYKTMREELGNALAHRTLDTKHKATLYGCSAGVSSYTITWDGKLVGCQLLGDCWTYPFEDGFQKAWDHFPEQVNILPKEAPCTECTIKCNACPAVRLAETGSVNGFSEYVCRESKLANEMNKRLIHRMDEAILN